uniref:Rapid alkalinization factor 1 n=1 Tax=Leersia perrieri TaxID=77586 RepID=A0A0D9XRT8_9ORYZ
MKPQVASQLLLFAAMVGTAALLSTAVDVGVGAFKATEAMVPMHALRRLADVEDVSSLVEEEEEAAYPRRRMLYSNQYVSYNGLTESKAACYGSCPGRGQPYSSRGCQNIYQCNNR